MRIESNYQIELFVEKSNNNTKVDVDDKGIIISFRHDRYQKGLVFMLTPLLFRFKVKGVFWGICLFLSAYLQVGCCTIDTRFTRYPSEVKSVFPSSRRIFTMLDSNSRMKPAPVSDMGSACIIGLIFLGYPLVEIPPALATDTLLWPLDYYYISQRRSKNSLASPERPKAVLEK